MKLLRARQIRKGMKTLMNGLEFLLDDEDWFLDRLQQAVIGQVIY